MSKINVTYSSGYYIAPDVDFRKLEEQQRQEQRGKRKKPGDDTADGGDDNVKRQTFAIPFDLICLHCNRRIARGSHVYTNRRATDQRYLDSIRIWELEIRCRFCQGKYYLRTDPETPKETGGYVCEKACKRVEGDFYALNKQNQAAREEWEKAKAEAEQNPLAALEKENEAARELEERNRRIEEEVELQAGQNDGDLLQMLRNRPRHAAAPYDSPAEGDDADEKDSGDAVAAPASVKPPPSPNPFDDEDDAKSGEEDSGEEDADERSYREFAESMERRWRELERLQRERQREELENAAAKPVVRASEVQRVLARYGGDRGAVPAPAVNNGAENGASSSASVSAPSDEMNGATSTVVPLSSSSSMPVSAAPSASSLARNKFFLAGDDDGDDDDANGESPQPPVSSARTSLRSGGVRTAPRLPPRPPLPRGNSALLRSLLDDDDSDEDE